MARGADAAVLVIVAVGGFFTALGAGDFQITADKKGAELGDFLGESGGGAGDDFSIRKVVFVFGGDAVAVGFCENEVGVVSGAVGDEIGGAIRVENFNRAAVCIVSKGGDGGAWVGDGGDASGEIMV